MITFGKLKRTASSCLHLVCWCTHDRVLHEDIVLVSMFKSVNVVVRKRRLSLNGDFPAAACQPIQRFSHSLRRFRWATT